MEIDNLARYVVGIVTQHSTSPTPLATPTFTERQLMPLLREKVARQTLLSTLVLHQLKVHDGPALVPGDPNGADVDEFGQSIREVVQLVAGDVEDAQAREGGDGVGKGSELVVA